MGITYVVDATASLAHTYRVTLRIDAPAGEQRLSLPVWIPGSYLVREFGRHLSRVRASQGGAACAVQQLDKATWQVRSEGGAALEVSYEVYALDLSVRAAFLDTRRGFFNGTSVFLRVDGREAEPHRVELRALPEGWQVATALPALDVDAEGRGLYQAPGYDELVDHPVELGTFWRGRFTARGIPHEYVVAGALPDFDGERLLKDVQRICEAEIDFWHQGTETAPFERYVFLHNLVEEGHGGLEHRASTALISPRRDMPQVGRADASDGYVGLLGLVSHEYFHTWNVKRLRPAEFAKYDYTRENYTELLWFFEGFTSYYDDLLLLRAGLIDMPRYLRLLSRAITQVAAQPGRRLQSVAQASFDAWVKYYRGDENTANATISYYNKGALVALALDLTLRAQGRGDLDALMRALWRASGGGPIDEAAIAAALEEVGGRSYAAELHAWVHGTDELPLRALLQSAGIAWSEDTASVAQRIGARVSESPLTGVKITQVLRGGLAEQAGLSAGDEVLAVDGWRVRRLDDALRLLTPGQVTPWLVARDQRVWPVCVLLPADVPEGAGAVALKAEPSPSTTAAALRRGWLGA